MHIITKISAPLIATIIITSCVTQTKIVKNNIPTQAMAKATGFELKEIGEGHAIYMRHCSQCHEPKLPSTIPSEVWHDIVPGMAWNAGLSAEQEKQVTTYIKAASKYKEMNQNLKGH